MNQKLNEELVSCVKNRKWQDLLRSLPANEGVPIILDSIQDMNTLKTIASKLNTKGEDPNRYSFSGTNYITKSMVAFATPRK